MSFFFFFFHYSICDNCEIERITGSVARVFVCVGILLVHRANGAVCNMNVTLRIGTSMSAVLFLYLFPPTTLRFTLRRLVRCSCHAEGIARMQPYRTY